MEIPISETYLRVDCALNTLVYETDITLRYFIVDLCDEVPNLSKHLIWSKRLERVIAAYLLVCLFITSRLP